MSVLNIDLNQTPYFDDYDESKDFYRVLFNPAKAVQARELTQLQTITGEQSSRIAEHLFKDGSVVDGCHVSYHNPLKYVSVKNSTVNGVMTIDQVTSDYLLVGETSGVRASALTYKLGFESGFPSSNRFYVNYVQTGDSGEPEFLRGEYISIYTKDQDLFGVLNGGNLVDRIRVLDQVDAMGSGYGVTIGDGRIFHKGFMLNTKSETVIVKEFDTNPTGYRIGFDTREEIVTEDQDDSLLDNSAGFRNFKAPGAHRLRLTPFLIAKLRTDDSVNKEFFSVIEFDGPAATEQNNTSAYNKLGDEFALRTFEKSGNFVVKPFSIETLEGVDANTGNVDANLFSYNISSGTAYVRGYRVDKISTSNVVVERAITTRTGSSQIITANYGSYIEVDELVGNFDWKAGGEVQLIDTAQNTITDRELASGGLSGAVVGYANIRNFEYVSGVKGASDAKYLVYVTNIRMNSSKSFSNDVKSIHANSTSFGHARADVVLSSNFYANGTSYSYTQLYDSAASSLVFPIGVNALKTLKDSGGASDSQFVFRDVANATLQVNGFVSVALNPAGAGGTERLNASGTLTSIGEKDEFDVVLTTAVETANLSGTVSVTTSQSNVSGVGTSFVNDFKSGEHIKIGSNYRQVNAVVNSTLLSVTTAWSASAAANSYVKVFPQGTHLDLSRLSANVVVTSNTTFNINSGTANNTLSINAVANVLVSFPVLKTNSYPMGKDVNTDLYVKIDCSNNSANSVGPWTIGIPDVYKIDSVYQGTGYSNTNPDYVDRFALDTGQSDSAYGLAKLVIKPEFSSTVTGADKLLVKLVAFTANSSGGVGYFSVDSYPSTLNVAEIPSFTSRDGSRIELRDSIDFRPYVVNTATLATSPAGATVNPVDALVNNYTSATLGYIAAPDTNFQADITYYLPRRDIVVVNHVGDFSVVKGQPNEYPVSPLPDEDVMVIASTYVAPFPSLTLRESIEFKKPKYRITHDVKTNRRYTERDIGALDNRLRNVEYYTVLNVAEQKAKDLTIPDVNGLDRFKNGIYANPFNGHGLSRVNDFEYKIAIDEDASVARPFYKKTTIDYKYDSALSTSQRKGNLVLAPYTEEVYILQNYASKSRNCTESNWNWRGKMRLFPSYDSTRDEKRLPNVNVDVDLSAPWEEFANSPFATNFGDWRTKSKAVKTIGTNQTTKTTQERVITSLQVDTNASKQNLGKFVKDVSIEPFIKSRLISFVATNLKPKTTMHTFFDGVLVDDYVAPGVPSTVTDVEAGREDQVLIRSHGFGTALRSDSNGTVRGIFRIPAGKFRTGDRVLRVSDTNLFADSPITSADARFTASNITVTTQGISINTIEPEISVDTRRQSIVNTSRTTAIQTTVDFDGSHSTDPIAESYYIDAPESTSGMFVTSIGIFFKNKDKKLGCSVLLTETRLGEPDSSRVIARKHLTAEDIAVSENASVETIFTFDEPVFHTSGNYFSFLVKPDGDSPEYRIWLGEVGGYDVSTGVQIYQNPYVGVAFVSANMDSWTPLQNEDIKFKLYRANFSIGTTRAVLRNENDEFIRFSGLTRANTSTQVQVGDYVYTGNSTSTNLGANTLHPTGKVQDVDETSGTVTVDGSTGGWLASQSIAFHRPSAVGNNSLINANSLLATAVIDSVDNVKYHVVVPRFATLKPARTNLVIGHTGTSNTGVVDSVINVTNDEDHEFRDTTRLVKSFSNEPTANTSSSIYQVDLTTESQFVSPVIDLRRKSCFVIENLINDDLTDEDVSRYGKAATKFVSQIITLKEGNDAEDLLVTLSAYRPVGANVVAYAKFLNAEDGENIDQKVWTKLNIKTGEFNYSSPIKTDDFIDYDYTVPTSAPTTNPRAGYLDADGILTYTSASGQVYKSYKSYIIKLVLTSNEPARVPLLNDVGVIALQV